MKQDKDLASVANRGIVPAAMRIRHFRLIHGNKSSCDLASEDVWSIIKEVAIDKNVPTALFSYELSNTEMVTKLLSQITGISISNFPEGRIKQEEHNRVSEAFKSLEHAPLYLSDTPSLPFSELKDKIQTMVHESLSLMICN